MKNFFALVALCALLLPSAALAQSQPPPMMQPRPEMVERFKQIHEQMERIHRTERAQVLAALTPAHRTLLASIVGNLAIAATPDHKAAAARLDAALSPSEKSAVLAAHTTAMTQMRDAMHSIRATMQPPPGAPQPQGSARPQWHMRSGEQHHKPSAGELVLMIASGHGGMHGMPFGPPPPGMMMRYHNGPGMQGPPGAAPAPAPANT